MSSPELERIIERINRACDALEHAEDPLHRELAFLSRDLAHTLVAPVGVRTDAPCSRPDLTLVQNAETDDA